jgi:type VI secretion system protein ImpH
VTGGELRPGRTERTSTAAPPSADRAGAIRRDLLANAPYYDFYYVVGVMERLTPDAVRIGGDGPYAEEAIRFRHDHSLVFNSGDISSVGWEDRPYAAEDLLEKRSRRFEVTTTFLGLTGAVSPLPLYLAEEIAQAQNTAPVKRDFLDLFHHRMLSFVYRLGVKHDLAREYTRDATDRWSRRILALAGIDAWGTGGRPRYIEAWRLLRLSPLLTQGASASARTIELALLDVCREAIGDATIAIEQFQGDWTDLDPDQQMKLDQRNHALGVASVLGVKCFDKSGKAKVVIGPLGENFRRFLADGDMYPVVVELLSRLTVEPISFDLELVLSQEARPPFHLGLPGAGRMGVDAWLSSRTGPSKETRLKIELPEKVPDPDTTDGFGWRSKPQRQSAER